MNLFGKENKTIRKADMHENGMVTCVMPVRDSGRAEMDMDEEMLLARISLFETEG